MFAVNCFIPKIFVLNSLCLLRCMRAESVPKAFAAVQTYAPRSSSATSLTSSTLLVPVSERVSETEYLLLAVPAEEEEGEMTLPSWAHSTSSVLGMENTSQTILAA